MGKASLPDFYLPNDLLFSTGRNYKKEANGLRVIGQLSEALNQFRGAQNPVKKLFFFVKNTGSHTKK